jgi:hypothetical protein
LHANIRGFSYERKHLCAIMGRKRRVAVCRPVLLVSEVCRNQCGRVSVSACVARRGCHRLQFSPLHCQDFPACRWPGQGGQLSSAPLWLHRAGFPHRLAPRRAVAGISGTYHPSTKNAVAGVWRIAWP